MVADATERTSSNVGEIMHLIEDFMQSARAELGLEGDSDAMRSQTGQMAPDAMAGIKSFNDKIYRGRPEGRNAPEGDGHAG
jgi:hypothetical protein